MPLSASVSGGSDTGAPVPTAASASPACHRVLTSITLRSLPRLLGATHSSRAPPAAFPAVLPACPLCAPACGHACGPPAPASLARGGAEGQSGQRRSCRSTDPDRSPSSRCGCVLTPENPGHPTSRPAPAPPGGKRPAPQPLPPSPSPGFSPRVRTARRALRWGDPG